MGRAEKASSREYQRKEWNYARSLERNREKMDRWAINWIVRKVIHGASVHEKLEGGNRGIGPVRWEWRTETTMYTLNGSDWLQLDQMMASEGEKTGQRSCRARREEVDERIGGVRESRQYPVGSSRWKKSYRFVQIMKTSTLQIFEQKKTHQFQASDDS